VTARAHPRSMYTSIFLPILGIYTCMLISILGPRCALHGPAASFGETVDAMLDEFRAVPKILVACVMSVFGTMATWSWATWQERNLETAPDNSTRWGPDGVVQGETDGSAAVFVTILSVIGALLVYYSLLWTRARFHVSDTDAVSGGFEKRTAHTERLARLARARAHRRHTIASPLSERAQSDASQQPERPAANDMSEDDDPTDGQRYSGEDPLLRDRRDSGEGSPGAKWAKKWDIATEEEVARRYADEHSLRTTEATMQRLKQRPHSPRHSGRFLTVVCALGVAQARMQRLIDEMVERTTAHTVPALSTAPPVAFLANGVSTLYALLADGVSTVCATCMCDRSSRR
jgi:hypothetical protein